MKTQFEIPAQLNGKQLTEELNQQGIEIEYTPLVEEGFLILHISKGDTKKAAEVVQNHVGIFTEPTIAEKLASVGLSIEELKAALGSN